MERMQIKHNNILVRLKRNTGLLQKIMHPVWIYIFNVISDGCDAAKPECKYTCCSMQKSNALFFFFSTMLIFKFSHFLLDRVGISRLHKGRWGFVLIILLQEVLTLPSCRVLSDRGRRTGPEWGSQWQAHRSKSGKCQTLRKKQSFYAGLMSDRASPQTVKRSGLSIKSIKTIWEKVQKSQCQIFHLTAESS